MKLKLTFSIILCFAAATLRSFAAADLQVLVITGQPMPDGNGVFDSLDVPTLNNGSQVAFRAGADNPYAGVFAIRKSIPGILQIARESTFAPDGTNEFLGLFNLGQIALNQRGRAFFTGALQPNSGGPFPAAFAASISSGTVTEFVRRDRPVVNKAIGNFSGATALAVNNRHQVAMRVPFMGPLVGVTNDLGIMRFETTNALFVEVARKGDLVPGGNGRFSTFSPPNLNNAGLVAFASVLDGTSNGAYDRQAIYRSDGASTIEIARTSDTGGYVGLAQSTPAMNNAGIIAFRGDIYDGAYRKVVICSDGVLATEIARGGQSIPRTPSLIGSIDDNVEINDAGQVAFITGLYSPANEALVRGNGVTMKTVAQIGDQISGMTNTIAGLVGKKFSLNVTGQLAFTASLTGGKEALLFHDDTLGLVKIAKVGDALLGSTIAQLDFNGTSPNGQLPLERNGFNDLGEVAFWFKLADNRQGIALWTKPSLAITDFRLIGSDVVVSVTVPIGPTCILEMSTQLGAGFTPISTNVFTGTVGLVHTNFVHYGAASSVGQRFYRLRFEP